MQIPVHVASWVYEQGSLTTRLRAFCGSSFRVTVLKHIWQKPNAEESLALGITIGQFAIIREVILQNGDTPLVMARSIIPGQTLHGVGIRLGHLGTKPLGQILFADPRLRRLHMQITKLDASNWQTGMLERFIEFRQPVWGRRSVYSIGANQKVLVAEFFSAKLISDSCPI